MEKIKLIKLPKYFFWEVEKNWIFISVIDDVPFTHLGLIERVRGDLDNEVSAIHILPDGEYELEWEDGDNTDTEPFGDIDSLVAELKIRLSSFKN